MRFSPKPLLERWLADASTALQRGQYRVIQQLIAGCARIDPLTGITPPNWVTMEVEDTLAYTLRGSADS